MMLKETDLNMFEIANEVAHHTNAMLAYWDQDLVCRFANSAYLKWFGLQPKQMVGKMHMKQLLGPLFEKNLFYIKGVLKGKEQIFERDITLPSGEWRNTVATYTPDIADGQVIGFYVHVSDVTGLKKNPVTNYITEPLLKNLPDSETALDAVERTLRSFFFIGFPGILALAKQHFISESKLKRDFKAKYKTTIFNYFRQLQMEFAEKYMRDNNYSKKQMAAMLKFSNPSNFLVCYKKYLKDKAVKKQLSDLERANDDLYKILISQSPVAIAMFDKNFMFLAASQKWISDYHMEGKELNEINFHEIFPGAPGRWNDVHKKCLGGEMDCGEETFTRKDGSEFWLRWNMRPWMNSKQEIGGLIVFSEDITSAKQNAADNKLILDLILKTGELTHIGGWERDCKTGKANWNKVTKEILEVPKKYIPGRQPELHFCKTRQKREELSRLLKAATNYGQSFNLTTEIETAQGNSKQVRIIGFAEFVNGVCEKIHGIIQDIALSINASQ